jgi:putative membrane protein
VSDDQGLADPVAAERSLVFDEGLQPERTSLAWRRTGLALVVAALVAVRVLPEVLGGWAIVPAGFGLAATVGIFIAAHHRYAVVHRTLVVAGDHATLPSGVLLLAVVAVVAVGGCAALVVVLMSAFG